MVRYIVVSVAGGLILGLLDGLINANPYAQKLFEAYKPIAKSSVNIFWGLGLTFFTGLSWREYFFSSTQVCRGRQRFSKG